MALKILVITSLLFTAGTEYLKNHTEPIDDGLIQYPCSTADIERLIRLKADEETIDAICKTPIIRRKQWNKFKVN